MKKIIHQTQALVRLLADFLLESRASACVLSMKTSIDPAIKHVCFVVPAKAGMTNLKIFNLFSCRLNIDPAIEHVNFVVTAMTGTQ